MNKTIAIAFILTLMASSLILIGNISAQTGTNVNVLISTDTMWTSTGNPYTFVDDVIVAKNVTLTIIPGTVIDLKLASLIIDGTLILKGDNSNWITIQAQKRTSAWPPRIFFNSSSTP
jgi:hypothetical protein